MAKKHPNKHIAQAIQYALKKGWTIKEAGNSAHAFGILLCPSQSRSGCKISIFSTPRNPENHAKQIKKIVDKCTHQEDQNEDL